MALLRQSPFASRLEALLALAAFAGVALAADAVHRDREVFVRLGADRAEAHRAGGEAFDDLGRGLDLVERTPAPLLGTSSHMPRSVIESRASRR